MGPSGPLVSTCVSVIFQYLANMYGNSEGSGETMHQWAVKAWTSMHNLICWLCRPSEKRYEPGSTLFGKLVSSSAV